MYVKKYLKKFLVDAIKNAILVASVLGILFLFIYFYSQITRNTLPPADLLNVSLVTIIVLFNVIYTIKTEGILDENIRNRKVSFIERRFERFYYPLQNFLQTCIIFDSNSDEERFLYINQEAFNFINRSANPDYREFYTHKYLAKKETEICLDEFLEMIIRKLSTDEKEDIDLYEKLKTTVEEDIQSFKEELSELI